MAKGQVMRRIALSIGSTLAIMYIVAFVVYGGFSAILGLQPPGEVSPVRFLLSILVVKLGLSVAFVGFFYIAREICFRRWILYAFIWWVMFALGEVGQAIGPGYSWTEASAGIIAEAIYCPLAAFVVARLLRTAVSPGDST